MSQAIHIFTFTPKHLGELRWTADETHDIKINASPISGLHIVEIELMGCSPGDIRISPSIPTGAFVIFRSKISDKGIPRDVPRGDIMKRIIHFTIDNINNAAFIYSDFGVYPVNLEDRIPTMGELGDKDVKKSLPQIEAFLEHYGFREEALSDNGERQKQFQMW
jgi:hypothetical protein